VRALPADRGGADSDVMLLVAAYGGFALLLLGVGLAVHRFTRVSPAATGSERAIDLRKEPTT